MRDLEIFAQAVEITDPVQRARFVEAACCGDQSLEREIVRLLASYDKAGTIWEAPLRLDPDAVAGSEPAREGPRNLEKETRQLQSTDDDSDDWSVDTSQLIGPYRLLEKIGEGGFGQVFVAEQAAPLQRKVALKIIKPGMDSREVIARFAAERQALALMDHPNIARVFDGGTTPRGLPYFVMELVRGLPIVQFCDQAKLAMPQRLKLFLDTCRAIQHAHQKGIIHRDIKPSNVLVTLHDGEPVVKVIDFGVAKALNQRLTNMTVYTKFSFMIGTPAYMSPEQAELSGLDIDTRSDIYSLGVLLYELITGSPPFLPDRFAKATIDEMRRIIRDEEPLRPSLRVSTLGDTGLTVAKQRGVEPARLKAIVRGDLDWIVMKALAKDRAQRYETANGLAMDVQRFMQGEAIVARPPSWSYLMSRLIRRHRGFVVSAGLILAALILGTVVSLSLAFWAFREQRVARFQETLAQRKSVEATAAADRATAAEAKAHTSLLASRMAFTQLNLQSRRPGQHFESLRSVRESVNLARSTGTLKDHLLELRSQAIAALARVDVQLDGSLPLPPAASSFVSFTSDLARYAHRERTPAGDVVSIRATAQPDVELARVPVPYDTRTAFHDQCRPHLSPDGRFLTICTGTDVPTMLWDLQRNRLIRNLENVPVILGTDFSFDSQWLAIVQFDPESKANRPHLYHLPSGKLERTFAAPDNRYLAFSPDAKFLAASTGQGVWVFEVVSGKKVAEFPIPASNLGSAIAWSASGELLATSFQQQIWVWNVADGKAWYARRVRAQQAADRVATGQPLNPLSVLSGHEGFVDQLMFDRQHEFLLVSSSWDNTTRMWNVFTAAEQLLLQNARPSLSHDGSMMAIPGSRSVDLFRVYPGTACRWVYGGTQGGTHIQVAFGPDQRWFAVSSNEGCRFWSLPSLRPLANLGAGQASRGLAWDAGQASLLLGNSLGVYQLPLGPSQAGILQLGPSEQILANSVSNFSHVHCSRDGRWLLSMELEDWEPILVDRFSGKKVRLHRPERTQFLDLAPNGKWLALSTMNTVSVVDLSSGRVLAEFEVPNRTGLAFDPDSQQLVVCSNDDCQFIDTTTWRVVSRFSPSRRIITPGIDHAGVTTVVPLGQSELGLIRLDDHQLLANFRYVDAPRLFATAKFSPDDSYLVVTHETRGAAVWDIQGICDQLAELGLDWDDPPRAPRRVAAAELERMEVEPGDMERVANWVASIDQLAPPERIATLTRAIDSGVELPEAYMLRAREAMALGDLESACRDWKATIVLAPYAERWKREYASCLQQAGKFDEAYAILWELADVQQSHWASSNFPALCRLACANMDEILHRDQFRERIDAWYAALEGNDKSSAYGLAVGGLSAEARQVLGEAIGLGYFALGEHRLARPLVQKYAQAGDGSHFVLAVLAGLDGDLKTAAAQYQQGLDYFRTAVDRGYSKSQIHFFDRVRVAAQRQVDRLRADSAAPEDQTQAAAGEGPPTAGSFDALDLIRSASAEHGRLSLQSFPRSPQTAETLRPGEPTQYVYWASNHPDGSLSLRLPVPTTGRYRLSARLVKSWEYGIYRISSDDNSHGQIWDGYYCRSTPDQPGIIVSDEIALGEFTATANSGADPSESPALVILSVRGAGRNELSKNYRFGIVGLKWERVENE